MNDNSVGCAVFLVVGIAAAAIAIWESVGLNRARAELFSRLARRWNGRVTRAGLFSKPSLEISVDGVRGEVTFLGGGNSRGHWGGNHAPWTKVHFGWGTRRRLRVVPEGFTTWLRSIFGSGDLEVGSPDFDSVFWVESSDEAWARQILSREAQLRLLDLLGERRLFASKIVTLDVGPPGLVLKIHQLLVDHPQSLEKFIELAVLILEGARGNGAMAGVVFAAVETRGGSCPVCGHAVDGGKTCPECRTPHHDDCWKYSGGCARFGCRGRRSKAA